MHCTHLSALGDPPPKVHHKGGGISWNSRPDLSKLGTFLAARSLGTQAPGVSRTVVNTNSIKQADIKVRPRSSAITDGALRQPQRTPLA